MAQHRESGIEILEMMLQREEYEFEEADCGA